MDIVEIPIDRVVPYARNPRRNEEAVAMVAASIAEFGFRQPIVTDEQLGIIVGHTRYAAAKRLGLKTVTLQHFVAILGDPDDVITVVKNGVTAGAVGHTLLSKKGPTHRMGARPFLERRV